MQKIIMRKPISQLVKGVDDKNEHLLSISHKRNLPFCYFRRL